MIAMSRAMAAVHATGLRKSKQRNIKSETIDALFDCSFKVAIQNARRWIEECTEIEQHHNSFREYLEDGTILCKLMQSIEPTLIRRMNKLRSPFAYWENISFFLEACRRLGLQDGQLFDPEDLLSGQNKHSRTFRLEEHDSDRIKSVVATIYWLSRSVQQSPNYKGPILDQSCFTATPTLAKGSSCFDFDSLALSSPTTTPTATPVPPPTIPDHSRISTHSPPSDSKSSNITSVNTESRSNSRESPLLWIEQVSNLQSLFTKHSVDSQFIEEEQNLSQQTFEENKIVENNNSRNSLPTKSNTKSATFSSGLVFVHGSTSSSVLSPTTSHHLEGLTSTAASGVQFSPHHLSNSYGTGTDTIDHTGLLPLSSEEQLGFHSQVFTGSASQDSVPQFSSRDSESTFHVNLTQSSQPDSFIIADSNTQPENLGESGLHNLPSITEISNSTPIDTFDLHCGAPGQPSAIHYSYSQEYNRDSQEQSQPGTINLNATEEECDHKSSLGSIKSEKSVEISTTPVHSDAHTPSIETPHLYQEDISNEPQSPATDSTETPVASDLIEQEHQDLDMESSSPSRKRLMRVVPAGKEGASDINLTLFPKDETLGFEIEKESLIVDKVEADSPASRAGLRVGDKLLAINGRNVGGLIQTEIGALSQAVRSDTVSLTVERVISTNQSSVCDSDQPALTKQDQPIQRNFAAQNFGLDIQRVTSDALPHQHAPKVVYVDNSVSAPVRTRNGQLNSNDSPPDISSMAVEIGSVDSESRRSVSSNDGMSRSEFSKSPSLPSVNERLEHLAVKQSDLEEVRIEEVTENDPKDKRTEDRSDDSLRAHSDTQLVYSQRTHRQRRQNASFDQQSTPCAPKGNTRASSEPPEAHSDLEKKHSGSSILQSPINSVTNISPQEQINEIWREVEQSESSGQLLNSIAATEAVAKQDLTSEEPVVNKDAVNVTPNLRGKSPSKANTNKGIDALLSMLRSLNEKVGTYDEEDEFKMLEELLQSSKFQKAKDFYDKMQSLATQDTDSPLPEARRIVPTARQLRHHFREKMEHTPETEELRKLLRNPHMQAVLFCHDKVTSRDFYMPSTFFPKSSQDQEDVVLFHSAIDLTENSLFVSREAPLSRDIPSSRKENATIVYLQRTNRPLGCTIYKDEDAVFVGKLQKGCDAELSGVVREGDELLEINGIALVGKSTDEIIRIMTGEVGKLLAFTLIPVHDDNVDVDYDEIYVRAHFGYSAELDDEVPCKDLALTFQKGDILEVSNQDDPDWWQARKVFDDGGESLPGLIPARQLQQKREVLRLSYGVSVALEEKNRKKGLLSRLSKRKKKKIYYNQNPLSGAFQSVGHEVATYEDVVKLMPDLQRRRPIVLIGASRVGRTTLMRKLLESDPTHYGMCVPHTTRLPRAGEVHGKDYYFVSREDMEQGIHAGKFLEYAENRGNLHGLSVAAVHQVIENDRVPVLDLHPQALKVLGHSGLIPYIIAVSAPRLERLLMTRKVVPHRRKSSDKELINFTEVELQDLYHNSQEVMAEYSHYFDWVIVNDDLQVAADMLKEVARRIEEEPQWIPASWLEEL